MIYSKRIQIIFNVIFAFSAYAFFLLASGKMLLSLIPAVVVLSFAGYIPNMYLYCKKNISLTVIAFSFIIECYFALSLYLHRPEHLNSFLVIFCILIIMLLSAFFIVAITIYLKQISVTDNCNAVDNFVNSKIGTYGLITMFILIVIIIAINCFNGYIWVDEAFSLKLVKTPWQDMIKYTASDVHPPLYYVLLKAVLEIINIFSSDILPMVITGKLFSLFAYILTALLCYIKLRKHKSTILPIVLCIFCMPNLITYTVDIRMYSWALFFVTGTYLYALDIFQKRCKLHTWILLVIFSLCSAYTHNYALIAAASCWLVLFIWIIIYERKYILPFMISGSSVAIGYLPWLIVLLNQLRAVSDDYWIPPLSISTIFNYIFYIFGFGLFIFILAFFSTKEFKIKQILQKYYGLLITLGVLLFAIIVSLIVRPIFVERYIIPCLVGMWISLILITCKLNNSARTVTIAIILICAITTIPKFCKQEYNDCNFAKENMKLIDQIEQNDAVIFTSNTGSIAGAVSGYTDQDVYRWKRIQPYTFMIHPLANTDEIYKIMTNTNTVYYFEAVNVSADDAVPFDDVTKNSMKYIGTYFFDETVNVYQIDCKGN